MSTTLERLRNILITDYKLPPERLGLDANLADLGIDSLATVELLWSIEDAFQIKLPAQPVNLNTLRDVVRHIDELVAVQGAAAVPTERLAVALRAT